jgi:hypothetical protein
VSKLESLKRYLKSQSISWAPDGPDGVLILRMTSRAIFPVEVHVVRDAFVVTRATFPLTVPPHRHGATAELLHRLSSGLHAGALELGFPDGAVRFRLGMPVVGLGDLPDALWASLLEICAVTLETFAPGITAVAYGDGQVEAALQLCLGESEEGEEGEEADAEPEEAPPKKRRVRVQSKGGLKRPVPGAPRYPGAPESPGELAALRARLDEMLKADAPAAKPAAARPARRKPRPAGAPTTPEAEPSLPV